MFGRIKHIVIKEFIQVFRDKRMRFFLIVPPIVQLLMFGYVVTLDVEKIPTAVYDLDRSAASRDLVRRFEASGYFVLRPLSGRHGEVQDLLDRAEVLCALFRYIPRFQEKIRKAASHFGTGSRGRDRFEHRAYRHRLCRAGHRKIQRRAGSLARVHVPASIFGPAPGTIPIYGAGIITFPGVIALHRHAYLPHADGDGDRARAGSGNHGTAHGDADHGPWSL